MYFVLELFTIFYECIKYTVHDMILFPGKNLRNVVKFSWLLTLVSLIAPILKLPYFINWIGCGIASVFVTIIYIYPRRKVLYNEFIGTDVFTDVSHGTNELSEEGFDTSV